ncbi:MAG: PAS domain S-box protein [Ignavibacteria bacterium]|jgi:PAS domain S-box-containing protein
MSSSSQNLTGFSFNDIINDIPLGVLIFDRDWIITQINDNFFRFGINKKYEYDSLINKNIFDLDLFDDQSIPKEIRAFKNRNVFEKEITSFDTTDNCEVSIIIKGSSIFIENEFVGGILIIEDLKTKLSIRAESEFDRDVFDSFLSGLADNYVLVETDGTISEKSGIDKYKPLLHSKELKSLYNQVIENPAAISKEFKYTVEGFDMGIDLKILPYINSSKKIQFLVVLINDITGKSKIIDDLEIEIAKLKQYKVISEKIVDAVILLDGKGTIKWINEKASKLFEFTLNTIKGRKIEEILPPFDENYFHLIKADLVKSKSWESEIKIGERANVKYLSVKFGLLSGEDEIILICTDISGRAKIEKELRQSEERFRNIVTNTREYICTLDLNENITYVNPYFCETFGYNEKELLKLKIKDLINPAYLLKNDFKVESIINLKEKTIELPLLNAKKEKIFVLASFTPVANFSGRTVLYNGVFTDITDKKEAEKDLMLIRSVFDVSNDGIYVSANEKFVLVNNNLVNLFGYDSKEEIINKDPVELISYKDRIRIGEIFESLKQGESSPGIIDYTGIRKNGEEFFVESSVTVYKNDGISYIVSVLRDITESKITQNQLKESEERYRSITENLDESMWTALRQNGAQKANFYTSAIQKITGYSNEEFLSDPKLWYRIIHPEDVHSVVKKMNRFYKDRARLIERLEYKIVNKVGNIIWIENKISVLRNEQGEIENIYGLVRDVTLNKKAEEDLKKSSQNLQQLNETKDKFLSIISHDLRTPFSSILGFTDLLLTDREMPEDKQVQYITFIQDSSKNMLSLVNSLLDWTRIQTGTVKFEPERLNARFVINNSIQIMSGAAMQKNIELISDLEFDAFIHADENLLLQVFNNLISNAIKFTSPGGHIRISAVHQVEKQNIQFRVKDTGTGIKEADIPKLFNVESKFTTNGTEGEKGSGLGLSLVFDIIKKHGGDIAVESEYGVGTEFIFTFPTGSTKILLVDDVKSNRVLYSKLLKSLVPNYDIIEAENGKVAFDILAKTLPALVITDHQMPVMSGYDMVKQLGLSDLKYKPPIIILSSDLNESIIEGYHELGIEFVFNKPVNLSTFKIALDKSLKKAVFS